MLNKQGKDKIDYCDWTFNPISGCLHNCEYCYLKRMERRYANNMMEPKFHQKRMKDIKNKNLKPGHRVFVGSSGDMFGGWNSVLDVEIVIRACAEKSDVEFLFLTKNPVSYFNFVFGKNCWLGTTIDKTDSKNCKRFEDFVTGTEFHKGIKFISFEPLLSEIDVGMISYVDWIIIGADSTPGAVRPKMEWADEIIDAARTCRVPVWVKNNYDYRRKIKELPKGGQCGKDNENL